jgi:SAM-dependent methyltransferase
MTDSAYFYDTIARYYDAEHDSKTDDLEFYSELAATHGDPILDIGCGTGRIMFHLAAQGYQTVGVDFSAQMLARGKRRAQGRADLQNKTTFYEGDATIFKYPAQYPLVLLPYNYLTHFKSAASQRQVLANAVNALAKGGLLVIDMPNAGETYASANDNTINLERTFTDSESGHVVMQQSVSHLDRAEQLQHITWIYDEIAADGGLKRLVAPHILRHIFPTELDLLLEVCGLQKLAQYGGYEGEPFADGCERLIVLATHAKARGG